MIEGGTRREALGGLAEAVEAALAGLESERVVERIWAKDPEVWGQGEREVVDRLGWLELPGWSARHLGDLQQFTGEVRGDGIEDVVLLGMGGSSLGAEVLAQTFGAADGHPRLHVLDSTVPGWVRRVRDGIQPARTLWLVGSKSGSTAEINALFRYFWGEAEAALGAAPGRHFVAITDPDTGLESLARERGFRRTFLNRPDLGGRFSVLSHFGLVPAALLGASPEKLVMRSMSMAVASSAGTPPAENPGARLGAILGTAALAGRDKATLCTSPRLASFGLWAEQLVAESTGKDGRGVLPIAGEPFAPASSYRPDRLFVALRLEGDDNTALDRHLEALEAAGHPLVVLDLMDAFDLAAEFFRWELATAVAGRLLGIHPFDQPDVEATKRITRELLEAFKRSGALPVADPGVPWEAALAGGQISYLALMAYLAPSSALEAATAELRAELLRRRGLATTFGYAPRMLHSTGQFHKGGPAGGVFVQWLDASGDDLAIPGEPFGFGTLARAQADADARALQERGRPVVRLEVAPDLEALERLTV